jgi:hypothetical protein
LDGNLNLFHRRGESAAHRLQKLSNGPTESIERSDDVEAKLAWTVQDATAAAAYPSGVDLSGAKLVLGQPDMGSRSSPTDADQRFVLAEDH